jgi:two-component system nitrogen regulation response regulator NtrX
MEEKRPSPGKILLVDDETNIREGLKAILQKDGHEVRDVASADAALILLSTYEAEAAVLDIRMSGMTGTELLSALRAKRPNLAIVMLTGYGTLETAMTAVKEGAFDYLLKPAKPDALRDVIMRALTQTRRQREQSTLLETLLVQADSVSKRKVRHHWGCEHTNNTSHAKL